MNQTQAALRNEVRELAKVAFHRKLISGYGDGADINEHQIIYQGKPRHISLAQASLLLTDLLYRNQIY
jgi:hypothetical protein